MSRLEDLKEKVLKNHQKWLDEKVTVCDKCHQASCWQGLFMCDESRDAGTIQQTRRELVILGIEHTDHMLTDEQLAEQ